jgi:hypothetical protein
MHAVWQRPHEIVVAVPVRALPGAQLMVSVLLQQELMHAQSVQLEVHVVVPVHEPVPPAPKYWPHVPLVARPRDALARCARKGPSSALLAGLPARRMGCGNAHGRWSRSIAIRGRMSGARGVPVAPIEATPGGRVTTPPAKPVGDKLHIHGVRPRGAYITVRYNFELFKISQLESKKCNRRRRRRLHFRRRRGAAAGVHYGQAY